MIDKVLYQISLLLLLGTSLFGIGYFPDPGLSGSLRGSSGHPYRVKGKIWVAPAAYGENKPIATISRIAGDLTVGEGGTFGTLQIDMNSWESRFGFLDSKIRRSVLQTGRYPHATFNVYALEGINSGESALLKGELFLLGVRRWLEIPVKVHRFPGGAIGIEPKTSLYFGAEELGARSAVVDLNRRAPLLPERVKFIFRLDASSAG